MLRSLSLIAAVVALAGAAGLRARDADSSEEEGESCDWLGQQYPVGAEVPSGVDDPCVRCECIEGGEEPQVGCLSTMCGDPPCVDSVNVEDQCCRVCPNGPNCRYEDQILPFGEVRTKPRGEYCTATCQCASGKEWAQCRLDCDFPPPPEE